MVMEEALKRYYDHFGENYPLIIVDGKSDEEIIERINWCIEADTAENDPVYEDGVCY